MPKVLVAGAGRSSAGLIGRLAEWTGPEWSLTVIDRDPKRTTAFASQYPQVRFILASASEGKELDRELSACDAVISLLPPVLHAALATKAIEKGKAFFSASYVSEQVQALDEKAKQAGVPLWMELGFDPGIDHMLAARELASLRAEGAQIEGFYSWAGGLVSPQFDNNPWHYKVSWNPRNVVLAGRDGAHFRENGYDFHLPYEKLLHRLWTVPIEGLDTYQGYANRDSLPYVKDYQLEEARTVIRGSLRLPPYPEAWRRLIDLGLTDPDKALENNGSETVADMVAAALGKPGQPAAEVFAEKTGLTPSHPHWALYEQLGLFVRGAASPNWQSPADLLEGLLRRNWRLADRETDRVVLHTVIDYWLDGALRRRTVGFHRDGTSEATAMATTVGWPLAHAVRRWAMGELPGTGLLRPLGKKEADLLLGDLEADGLDFQRTDAPH